MAIPYEPEPHLEPDRCDNCKGWFNYDQLVPHPSRTIIIEYADGKFHHRRQNVCLVCYENEFGPMPDPPTEGPTW